MPVSRRGIGPCYQDKVGRLNSVRVGELLYPDHLRQRAGTSGEPQILSQIDHLHAAAAERSNDPIASADYGAGRDHAGAA